MELKTQKSIRLTKSLSFLIGDMKNAEKYCDDVYKVGKLGLNLYVQSCSKHLLYFNIKPKSSR